MNDSNSIHDTNVENMSEGVRSDNFDNQILPSLIDAETEQPSLIDA